MEQRQGAECPLRGSGPLVLLWVTRPRASLRRQVILAPWLQKVKVAPRGSHKGVDSLQEGETSGWVGGAGQAVRGSPVHLCAVGGP